MKDSSFKDNPISPRGSFNLNSLAHTVLLERYRLLLLKQMIILVLNRVISLLIVGFVAISIRFSFIQFVGVMLVSVVVTIMWLYERRTTQNQTQTLADNLARQSGKEELDFYIRSEYHVDRETPTKSFASYEPQAWFILTVAFAILQYTFGPLFLR